MIHVRVALALRSGAAAAAVSALVIRFRLRRDREAPLLVLFHDDGSTETAVAPLGARLWPGAPSASIRGGFRDVDGWRHLSDPASEIADLSLEESATERIGEAVRQAASREPSLIETVGVGIGGGADAVLALLSLQPALLTAAVLLRPRRRWADGWEDVIERRQGVEVMVAANDDKDLSAAIATLMLSRCGHRVLRWIGPIEKQPIQAARWLRSELRGDEQDEERA